MEYFGFGEYEFGSHKIIEPMARGISGTHRMNGIFLAYGRDIRPGVTVENAHLTDLAPTILHIMGEPVPGHMDGRILNEILPDGYRPVPHQATPWQQPDANDSDNSDGLTDEEKEILANRLRDLGYVG